MSSNMERDPDPGRDDSTVTLATSRGTLFIPRPKIFKPETMDGDLTASRVLGMLVHVLEIANYNAKMRAAQPDLVAVKQSMKATLDTLAKDYSDIVHAQPGLTAVNKQSMKAALDTLAKDYADILRASKDTTNATYENKKAMEITFKSLNARVPFVGFADLVENPRRIGDMMVSRAAFAPASSSTVLRLLRQHPEVGGEQFWTFSDNMRMLNFWDTMKDSMDNSIDMAKAYTRFSRHIQTVRHRRAADDNMTCAICAGGIEVVPPYGIPSDNALYFVCPNVFTHRFHDECMKSWFKASGGTAENLRCPICRAPYGRFSSWDEATALYGGRYMESTAGDSSTFTVVATNASSGTAPKLGGRRKASVGRARSGKRRPKSKRRQRSNRRG